MNNIVIEGADATGKSTLANFLSIKLRMPVKESEGPTRDLEHFLERAARYSQLENHIIVRHPHVSESVYGTARGTYDSYAKDPRFRDSLLQYFNSRPVVIHCSQNPNSQLTHKLKSHDTAEHVVMLKEKAELISMLYRGWAIINADFHYQIGHSMHRLLTNIERIRFDPFRDITLFHEKFGFPPNPRHKDIPLTLAEFRHKFMGEEANEYLLAVNLHRNPDILDALVDQMYITLGTAYLHGFNRHEVFAEAWRRVHRANMQKQRSTNPSPHADRGSAWDIVKPAGWEPPCLDDLTSREVIP